MRAVECAKMARQVRVIATWSNMENKTRDQILDELAALPVLHPPVQRQALVAKLRETPAPQRPAPDENETAMWRVLLSAALANSHANDWSLPLDRVNVNPHTMVLGKYHEVAIGDRVIPYTWDGNDWQHDKDAVTDARVAFAVKALARRDALRNSVRWSAVMSTALLAVMIGMLAAFGTWAAAFVLALLYAPIYTILVQQMIGAWRDSNVAWREHVAASAAIDRDTAAELNALGINTVVM